MNWAEKESGPLRKIANQFGERKTWNASIELFGFPPTWMTTTRELLILNDHLENER